MTINDQSKPIVPQSVYHMLASLRWSVFFWLAMYGISIFVLVTGLVALIDFGVDWLFRIDERVARGVILALILGGLSWLAYRRIIRPLRQNLSDDALALRVESQHRELGQALISSLQFARINFQDVLTMGVSPQLIHATIEQGANISSHVNFRKAIDPKFRRHAGMITGGAVACIIAFAAGFILDNSLNRGDGLCKWFRRNVLLSNDMWAKWTNMSEPQYARNIAQGDNWTVAVEITKGNPRTVSLEIEYFTLNEKNEKVFSKNNKIRKDLDHSKGSPKYTKEIESVVRSFRFTLRAGDDTKEGYVNVVERPRMEELTIYCLQPTYVDPDQKQNKLDYEAGQVEVFKGSTLYFEGLASKQLSSVKITLAGKEMGRMQVIEEQGSKKDMMRFKGGLPAKSVLSGSYMVEIVDTDNLAPFSQTEVILKVLPDAKPGVRAKLSGISQSITNQATIPIVLTVRDDHGLEKIEQVYKVGTALLELPEEQGLIQDGALNKLIKERKNIEDYEYRFNVSSMGLSPGGHISLYLSVTDNCPDDADLDLRHNVANTPTFYFNVVTQEDLLKDMVGRARQYLREYDQMISEQRDIQASADLVRQRMVKFKEITQEDMNSLAKCEKRQRQMTSRLEGMANNFDQLAEEMFNNRVDNINNKDFGGTIKGGVVVPLKSLAKDWSDGTAVRGLDNAGRSGLKLEERQKSLMGVVENQNELISTMNNIRAVIVKIVGDTEAIVMAEQLKREAEEILNRIKERLKDIYGASSPSTQQDPAKQ